MFRLIATMRRGSATSLPQASARFGTLARNEIPGGFVEWIDR
jgi:hypothetical protein